MPMWPACCAATRGGSRALFVDHRAASEHAEFQANPASDDFSNRLARGRILREWVVAHALKNLEAARLFGRIAGNCLVNVGWHHSVSGSEEDSLSTGGTGRQDS